MKCVISSERITAEMTEADKNETLVDSSTCNSYMRTYIAKFEKIEGKVSDLETSNSLMKFVRWRRCPEAKRLRRLMISSAPGCALTKKISLAKGVYCDSS